MRSMTNPKDRHHQIKYHEAWDKMRSRSGQLTMEKDRKDSECNKGDPTKFQLLHQVFSLETIF